MAVVFWKGWTVKLITFIFMAKSAAVNRWYLNDFPTISIKHGLCKYDIFIHSLCEDLINAGLGSVVWLKRTTVVWLKVSLSAFFTELTDNFNLKTPSTAHITTEASQLCRSWISLDTLQHPASCPQRATEKNNAIPYIYLPAQGFALPVCKVTFFP